LAQKIIINEIIVNKWIRWYFDNIDAYYFKVERFLDKNYKLVKGKRKYRNLLYYNLPEKYQKQDENYKKPIIFFSKNRKKPVLFLQMERYNAEVEKNINSFLKKYIKVKKKETGIYYFMEFNKNIEVNKRKLCEESNIDYDTLHYKVAKMSRPNGTLMFFKNGVKFLSYPSMEEINKEKKYVMKIVKKNMI